MIRFNCLAGHKFECASEDTQLAALALASFLALHGRCNPVEPKALPNYFEQAVIEFRQQQEAEYGRH